LRHEFRLPRNKHLVNGWYCPYNLWSQVADGDKTLADEIKHKDWRVADRTADLLCIDREVCRRAFYQEPEERVHEIVQWVLSEPDLLRHGLERMIERWACEHGAGVYSRNRQHSSLEQVEGIVARVILRHHAAA
jgi:hypothetical protein